MKIIETFFRESLAASINDAGMIEFPFGGSQITPVEVLLGDKAAYQVEYSAWLNDVWLENHRQRLKGILSLHGNAKRYADLCRAVGNGSVVPAVGSGMSAPSGFMLWGQFLHSLRSYSSTSQEELDTLLRLYPDLAKP